MKRLFLSIGVAALLLAAAAVSQQAPERGPAPREALTFRAETGARNPWTHLRFNDDASDFQFLIVSDRTGGHRERIFSKAVEQINLLQPEFVLSVGDLIEGYTEDRARADRQWKQFQGFVSKLEMPFFYVPGNHDISNKAMEGFWQDKFGRRYYHFTYKGVLFLCLFTDEPPGSSSLSKEQIAWAKKVLAENPSPRWTVVAMHKPIWAYGDLQKSGWLEVEEALAGRPYTVFAGHVHRYQKFIRNGMNYYMLATTGGVSRMRGIDYGEFDHVVWVTMKDDGPRLANLLLDGILPEDLRVPETEEPAAPRQELKTYPVRGTAYLDGVPAYGTGLNFTLKDPKTGRLRPMGNARVQPDGTFEVTTYRSFDGAPAGEYVVTFHPVGGFPGDPPTPPEVEIPAKYRDVKTSPLRAEVKADAENEFIFELTR